jgi:hypothetical protein
MTPEQIQALAKRVQEGTATEEEQLVLVREMQNAVDILREGVKEMQIEKIRESIK